MIEVVVDDLAFVRADAVLRPADDRLEPAQGAAARLDTQAGPRFADLRRVQNPLVVGAAVVALGAVVVAVAGFGVVGVVETFAVVGVLPGASGAGSVSPPLNQVTAQVRLVSGLMATPTPAAVAPALSMFLRWGGEPIQKLVAACALVLPSAQYTISKWALPSGRWHASSQPGSPTRMRL